jgi:hypothetical protein
MLALPPVRIRHHASRYGTRLTSMLSYNSRSTMNYSCYNPLDLAHLGILEIQQFPPLFSSSSPAALFQANKSILSG